jgi:5-formyltetrahydrofolate cyclo-ligase
MDLSPGEYDTLNRQLLFQFSSLDLEGIHCIHLFLPMLERREPNTFMLIEWLKANYPEITRVYPKANFGDNTMTHFYDDGDLKLSNNSFNIPEPIAGNLADIDKIDIAIIPLLILDIAGYRVGYGKGFYDRFTAQCKPGTQFIGISFFEPVDAIDDINSFDIPLQACITPEKIWQFDHSVPL